MLERSSHEHAATLQVHLLRPSMVEQMLLQHSNSDVLNHLLGRDLSRNQQKINTLVEFDAERLRNLGPMIKSVRLSFWLYTCSSSNKLATNPGSLLLSLPCLYR